MRNIHLFEQFMKENGLEYDVQFTAEYEKKYCDKYTYKLIICKVKYCNGEEIEVMDADTNGIAAEWIPPALVFDSSFKIVKKPWRPKHEEQYFFINAYKDVMPDVFHNDNVIDNYRYLLGNCFRTEKQAKKHKDDVFKVLRGKPLVKWED